MDRSCNFQAAWTASRTGIGNQYQRQSTVTAGEGSDSNLIPIKSYHSHKNFVGHQYTWRRQDPFRDHTQIQDHTHGLE